MIKVKTCLKTLLFGFIAGLCISLGGLLNIIVNTYIPNFGGKILGSFLFPIGLMLICFFRFNLYTGKIGYVLKRKNYLDLVVMLIGNLLATMLTGFIFSLLFKSNNDIINVVNSIVDKKINLSIIDLSISGILCGILVFTAVDLFSKSKNVVLKVFSVLLPIALFVFLGYDHCIANSFYFAFDSYWNSKLIIVMITVIFANSLGSIIMNKICN